VVEEYMDVRFSGSKDRRPALDRLMLDARRGRVDIVAVWSLDRFGRKPCARLYGRPGAARSRRGVHIAA